MTSDNISEGSKKRKRIELQQRTRKSPRNHNEPSQKVEQPEPSQKVQQPDPKTIQVKEVHDEEKAKKLKGESIKEPSQKVQQPDFSKEVQKKPKEQAKKDEGTSQKRGKSKEVQQKTKKMKEQAKKDTKLTKQVKSHSQPEPNRGKDMFAAAFQFVGQPIQVELATQKNDASSSAPTEDTTEVERKAKWEMFGLPPPPFPVGKPPPVNNEKKNNNTVLNVAQEILPPNLYDANMSKERLSGILEGSKDIYTMFGLPVPKWIEDGIDKTLNLPSTFSASSTFAKTNSKEKKPDGSSNGKGK